MERKKRSKGRGWESCYVKKIYGTFGVEMRAYGQKLVKFCTHTHTRLSYSSNDTVVDNFMLYAQLDFLCFENGNTKAYYCKPFECLLVGGQMVVILVLNKQAVNDYLA